VPSEFQLANARPVVCDLRAYPFDTKPLRNPPPSRRRASRPGEGLTLRARYSSGLRQAPGSPSIGARITLDA
jgi:hypothetical protein